MRVYLRILGRIPTVEELESYVASSDPNRREQLVDTLLSLATESSGAYQEEYARHWATYWANLLIGRTGGDLQLIEQRWRRRGVAFEHDGVGLCAGSYDRDWIDTVVAKESEVGSKN